MAGGGEDVAEVMRRQECLRHLFFRAGRSNDWTAFGAAAAPMFVIDSESGKGKRVDTEEETGRMPVSPSRITRPAFSTDG